MPSVILLGSLLMNTPQQNAGAFVGEYNFAGWDANRKMSQAHGGEFGFFNWSPGFYNLNLDSFEVVGRSHERRGRKARLREQPVTTAYRAKRQTLE
ncbi:hypothetical protein [Alicyclobacillus mali (ex Roth et al. 2021)]|uniref:hypothetical protein n=1 Tax=Alicyclobacillus mali (ex Roth et al. 2021) TaxID=1123961 RepID=UPI001F5C695E|nr:hypothetical protein [Alicyclobacillus mali (ex Roth et al. 2021)]